MMHRRYQKRDSLLCCVPHQHAESQALHLHGTSLSLVFLQSLLCPQDSFSSSAVVVFLSPQSSLFLPGEMMQPAESDEAAR